MQVGRDVITAEQIIKVTRRKHKSTIRRWVNMGLFPEPMLHTYKYKGKVKRKFVWSPKVLKLAKILDKALPNPRNGPVTE